jgi:hypothetical protein
MDELSDCKFLIIYKIIGYILIFKAIVTMGLSLRRLYLQWQSVMEFLSLPAVPTTHKLKDLLRRLMGSLKQGSRCAKEKLDVH